jgi:triphosphatase
MEIELKLAAEPQSLPQLKRALRKMSGHPREARARLQSIYYDTPDLALRQRNMTLRVRKQDRKLLQTIKSGELDGADALARHEWEDPVDRPEPDPRAPHAIGKLPAGLAAALRPVFVTDIERTTLELHPAPDTHIEAAIDQGEIKSADGKARTDVSEVELELKSGQKRALYDIALQLAEVAPLRIGALTKAERGYLLLNGEHPPVAVHMTPLPIKAKMTVEEVVQAIGRQCLSHVIRNEPAALAGDPEGIHQMRVAVRRLRSFLSSVKPMLPPDEYRRVGDDLKWLAGELSDARNWDVFAANLLPPVKAADGHGHSIGRLARAADRARREAHEHAETAIRSQRYTAVLLKLGRWFEGRAWRDQPVSEKSIRLLSPVGDEASRIVRRQWRKVRARSKNFKKLGPAERHKFRIAVKKLRYTSDLLRPLFDPDDVRAFVKRLKPLQDDLGHVNDVRTAHDLLKALPNPASRADAAVNEARGTVLGWYDRELVQRETQLRKHVRKLRRADGFW